MDALLSEVAFNKKKSVCPCNIYMGGGHPQRWVGDGMGCLGVRLISQL
jgi:hypothetical protein